MKLKELLELRKHKPYDSRKGFTFSLVNEYYFEEDFRNVEVIAYLPVGKYLTIAVLKNRNHKMEEPFPLRIFLITDGRFNRWEVVKGYDIENIGEVDSIKLLNDDEDTIVINEEDYKKIRRRVMLYELTNKHKENKDGLE